MDNLPEKPFTERHRGRGAGIRPNNRFVSLKVIQDYEHLPIEDDTDLRGLQTEYFEDTSKSIVSQNNSPDLPFRYSLNPYRGCIHGCSYCYARPTHEFLGLDAGLDFESRIIVKQKRTSSGTGSIDEITPVNRSCSVGLPIAINRLKGN